MTATIYVLQHGNAVSKEEDAERPLSTEGRHDIERIAGHLTEKDVHINRVFHSGKLRAEQTAKIITDKLALNVEPEAISGISPNDDPVKFIEELKVIEGTVLIASHMPFVSSLCSMLLTGKLDAQFRFTPGTIACVDYAEGRWSLMCLMSPTDL